MLEIINLNFISLGAIIAAIFTFSASFYLLSIREKSKATIKLALGFLFISFLSVAYILAFSIYHPIGAYHRWISVFFVLPSGIYMSQFFFYFPQERNVGVAKLIHIIQWIITVFISIYWAVYTYIGQNIVFQHEGQYWDFSEQSIERIIAIVILIYIIMIPVIGTWRSIVTKGKERYAVISITVSLTIVSLLPGLGNYFVREGIWTKDIHHIVYSLCTVFGWFITAIFYLNLTRDRTSFLAKISGVSLTTFLMVILFISFFTLGDREKAYDMIHIHQVPRIISDKNYRPPDLEYLRAYSNNNRKSEFIISKGKISIPENHLIKGDESFIINDKKRGKHYKAFTYLDSQHSIIYEAGYNYLSYRNYIHTAAFKLLIIVIIVTGIILIGYQFFFAGTLLNPLKTLIKGLRNVKEGNFDVPIIVKVEDEIGFMSRSFNNMVNALKRATIERDIAERALRSAEAKFRGLVEQSLSGIYIVQDRKIQYANPRFAEIFGYTQEEVLALKSILDVVAKEDREMVAENIRLRETKEVETHTYIFKGLCRNGKEIYVEVHGAQMELNNRPAVIGTLVEITDRIATQVELSQEKERLGVTLTSIGDGVIATDTSGKIQLMNTTAEKLTGWIQSEVKGNVFKEVFILKDRKSGEPIPCPVNEILFDSEAPLYYSDHLSNPILIARDGEEKFISYSSSPIIGNRNTIFGVVVAFHDITDEVFAKEQMIKMRSFLRNIINSMPSVLVSVDKERKILHWNLEAEKATNITAEKAIGKSISELYPIMKDQVEFIDKAISERSLQKIEKYMYREDNETYYTDIMVYPLIANGVEGAVIRVDDISERVHLEEMMVQTEKMLTVGGLAAGMAHEINNPLGAILMSAQNIIRRLSPQMEKNIEVANELGVSLEDINIYMENRGLLKMLEAILEMGERSSNIVSNMLSFSRRSETKKESKELIKLIDKAVNLASHDYDLKKKYDFRHINIIRNLDNDIPQIMCSETEIEQVLLNLFKNSAQAMSTKDYRNDKPTIEIILAQEDSMIKISIKDNGPGMDKKTIYHAFEPFFTTKEPGVGTGLGLSVSYHIIVNNHNGIMKVESEKGKGATFIIYLPIHE